MKLNLVQQFAHVEINECGGQEIHMELLQLNPLNISPNLQIQILLLSSNKSIIVGVAMKDKIFL